jgi:hypothetical protein
MLKKNNQKSNLWKYACSSRFSSLFMLFQVNVVAQKKRKNHSEYNWNESGTSNHFEFDREEIKCWKDFFKEEYNLEMNFQELQQTKTTN